MELLPKPEVVRCFFEKSLHIQLPAMVLKWDAWAPGVQDRTWYLPDNLVLKGPAPERFGVTIIRQGDNAFQVRLLWNEMGLSWNGLTRTQIMSSSLAMILQALGTDLWYLLEQPIEPALAA